MKKFIIPLLLLLAACENTKICPDIIKGKPGKQLISDREFKTVTSLFSLNNINTGNFLVYRLQTDELGMSHVRCYQYINDLKAFTGDVIFHFSVTGHYSSLSGELISAIDIDPTPVMNQEEVKAVFFKKLDDDSAFSSGKSKIEDGCLQYELGYYNLNAGISYAESNFCLAWKVSPDGSGYPYALINDSGNSIIYYDNGIRFYTVSMAEGRR